MRYLKRTKDYKLTYKQSDPLDMVGYQHSDFVGCFESRKLTSGYVFLLARGIISWGSAKKTLVTISTIEAKFVSCFEAMSQAI